MNLTEPQLWALLQIKKKRVNYPSGLGQLMLKRPGIETSQEFPGKTHYKAQSLGRMGGAMAYRLKEKGLIGWRNTTVRGHTFRGDYYITDEGQKALDAATIPDDWKELL